MKLTSSSQLVKLAPRAGTKARNAIAAASAASPPATRREAGSGIFDSWLVTPSLGRLYHDTAPRAIGPSGESRIARRIRPQAPGLLGLDLLERLEDLGRKAVRP